MNNPYYNSEGYADPTAYAGTKNIIREENETERRAVTRFPNVLYTHTADMVAARILGV